MFFSKRVRALGWLSLGVLCLVSVAWLEDSRVVFLDSLHDVQALPLPASVVFTASIISLRDSSGALVLELENNGKLTCYWRKPPALRFFFRGDLVRVMGKIELTPRGKLCVVESLASASD
jgi:hypothetical protein